MQKTKKYVDDQQAVRDSDVDELLENALPATTTTSKKRKNLNKSSGEPKTKKPKLDSASASGASSQSPPNAYSRPGYNSRVRGWRGI